MTYKLFPQWNEQVVFSPDGPQPQVLEENNRIKVVLAGLESGQKIPEHSEAQGVFQFLAGDGWMTVDGERFAVSQGAIVIIPQGASRRVEAATRLAFIATRVAF